MNTDRLIAELAAGLTPVRRLPPPPVLLLGWTLFASAVIGAAILLLGGRGPLLTREAGLFESMHLVAAALTALLAGLAAFELALPDRDRRWSWLPLPAVALWLGTMGAGCVAELLRLGPGGIEFYVSWSCMAFIIGLGVPMAGGILWLTRHAAGLRPGPVAACGALSAAAFASLGLTFVHPGYGPVMVLVWHGLSVLALTALVAKLGPAVQRAAA